MRINEAKDGAIIELFVKPNSKKFEVTIDDNEIVVRCTEDPVRGKVNRELVKELSKLFHSKVEITSGFTSRQKTLLIRGIGKSEVEHLLRIK